MMFLHMTGVMIDSCLEYGYIVKRLMFGSSVARAKAAKVSISKLTQSISTVLRGGELGGRAIALTIMRTIATMLMTS